MVDCTCRKCGKVFKRYPSEIKRGGGGYCSNACYWAENSKGFVEHACENCGKKFRAMINRIEHGNAKYCSQECFYIARSKPTESHCLFCSKQFKSSSNGIKGGRSRFCSRECWYKYAKYQPECICVKCGKTYINYPYREERKFCSRECSWETATPAIKRFCEYCSKEFSTTQTRLNEGKGRFCCWSCARKGAAKTGAEHVLWKGGKHIGRGENWTRQRRLVRERDGGVCQVCQHKPTKRQRKNAVHHIKPYREFNGDYVAANDLSNLITLCDVCHSRAEHGKIPVPRRLL